ncbi:hypothetical protein BpHYR1_001645 [Brachionus plicatilis]|uniref:Snake toxin/toxin-like domain-containing protein n=1 Tax=Brachionus plicatilis TaxID=10195 RepID=A0A3M7P7D5_BRAPC|nr:hypothetical protein BpHYR1_001645 [Brachionus plicatilis]
MLLIVLFIPVFLNLIPSSNGLKCYVCNGCSTAESLTDCASGESFCKKIYGFLTWNLNIARTCASKCTETNVPVIFGNGGSVSCCQTDGCNSTTNK